jgi:dTDP-4-dehydrorhamnose reductase
MKVLVIGGSGMLGHKLIQAWEDKFEVWTTVRSNFIQFGNLQFFNEQRTIGNINIENIKSVEETVGRLNPDVIVNGVGIIKQLPTAKDVIKTLTVNSIFPHQLAEIANQAGARLITVSTDCVFNGEKGNYSENDCSDAYDLYGKSKYLGEVITENCLTIRTSIIGRELYTSHSLVEWFLSNQGAGVKGFVKAIYSGFPTLILADILADIIINHPEIEGLYHISSEPINKFDLLQLIKEAYQARIEIEPFEDFEIDRSLDSTKFRQATGFKPPEWREMIYRWRKITICIKT